MAFSPQFLDELRERVGLADVIGRRVRLTKKGREHMGLCPFHKEKTPSFTVNEEKGFYHCFGCGAHGSVFDFVMQTEGVGFPDAVERLAGEAGMEVPVATPEERAQASQAKTLYDVLEKAAAWFERNLRLPVGKEAMAYLKGRGLDDEVIGRFRLGFAPDSRGALKAALRGEGIDEALMVAAGLLIRPDDKERAAYDRFRGRIIFPISDRRGRVIAFGGRILGEGEPKYLNSPETSLFHKGRTLYGLFEASKKGHETGELIVVEGYTDVIALHHRGFSNAVAPLGTALTEDHIKLLWRIAAEPVLCFDGDAAGGRAAGRAMLKALPILKPGTSLRMVTLPAGEDPDSLIRNRGAEAMQSLLNGAIRLSEALWRMEKGNRSLQSPEERAALEDRLKHHGMQIEDKTVRSHFLSSFRSRLWEAVRGTPKKTRGGGPRGRKSDTRPVARGNIPMETLDLRKSDVMPSLPERREEILLSVLLNHLELFDEIGERLGMLAFSGLKLDKLRQEVLKTLTAEPSLDGVALERHLRHSGFSEGVDRLFGPRIYEHAYFARPDASLEAARNGWEETYTLYKQYDLRTELKEAAQRLADDMSPEAFDKFRALKKQEQEMAVDLEDGSDHAAG